MTRLFLGVDGGQSGTVALIGTEDGSVVGVGRAGPCNHVGAAEGRARFVAAIGGSLEAALTQAGLSGATFESACFGFSGGPADKDALTRELIKAARYVITHDASIALAGATAGAPGIIAIAGTGSIVYGKSGSPPFGPSAGQRPALHSRANVEQAFGLHGSDGSKCFRTARAGGLGYVFGDEGSAFDLVRQALRAVVYFEQGWGPRTVLTDLLLESTGAADADSLLHLFYTDEYPRQRVASLAPLVDRAAGFGDAVAQDILKHAAQSLATFTAAVRRQLFDPVEAVQVSYTGGVFGCRVLLERFRMLVELDDNNRLTPPRYGPAAGALIEAYRAAGVECTLKEVPEEKGATP